MLSKLLGVKTSTTRLPLGHLVWIREDGPVDLASVTLEDLKLLEYVTQEAAIVLSARNKRSRRVGPSIPTLTRVRELARKMHQNAIVQDRRS